MTQPGGAPEGGTERVASDRPVDRTDVRAALPDEPSVLDAAEARVLDDADLSSSERDVTLEDVIARPPADEVAIRPEREAP